MWRHYLGRITLLQGGIVYRALLLLLFVILLRLVRAWLLGLSTLGHDPLATVILALRFDLKIVAVYILPVWLV